MNHASLVWSGRPLSRIAMGCEPLGGTDWGEVDLPSCRLAVRRALDAGITVFDTADVYGLGVSESELSEALGKERHSVFIITKFGVRWESAGDGERARTFIDTSPEYLATALEGSLKRLAIEAIPLYLVHWPHWEADIDATLGALESAREQGKLLNYGLSNFTPSEIRETTGGRGVAAIEAQYNLLVRHRTDEAFRAARERGLATFGYGPLAQGLLSGKYTRSSHFDENDRRSRLPQFAEDQWERNDRILGALSRVASARGKTMAQVAIRWVLDSGLVETVIAGAKSPSQIDNNAGSLGWALSDAERATLERAAEETTGM